MTSKTELKKIKKLYGEKFMHLCRKLFPTILEQEGLLLKILQNSFATNTRTLGEDITEENEEQFKNYIYSKLDVEKEVPEIVETKTPEELLDEAGYYLYECTTEEEIQSFKKYYKKNEQLCTFNGGRLNHCIVFWAVKKNVEEIKRENFKKPRREDEYGTSVMSIQFSKTKNSTVSIKNRYNHRVNNPDATYGNDLDKIIPGLRRSFEELLSQRGITLYSSNIEEIEIPKYTKANDGKYYKYNLEINGIYYCPQNIIIDHGDVIKLEPEKHILIDYYILNKMDKTIKTYDDTLQIDSFLHGFKSIKKITEVKDKEKGTKRIIIQLEDDDNPVIIEIDRENNIIGYKNERLTQIGDFFECYNISLRLLELPNVMEIGNYFLYCNEELNVLELPNLEKIKDYFMIRNKILKRLFVPNLRNIGNHFMDNNRNHEMVYNILEEILKKACKGLPKKQQISTEEIANLDRENNLTTTEVNYIRTSFLEDDSLNMEKS